MSADESDRDPVEVLAEEFVERFRRGERPAVTEYVKRYPDLAQDIRDLFPALVVMEGAETGSDEGPFGDAQMAGGQPLEQLGEYRILREIGRGGMGVVYEAVHQSLDRHVALKVLPNRAARDEVQMMRFRREARAAARLHHTAIVPVFDVGVADGVHYYAMQFIQGQSLCEVMAAVRRIRAGSEPAENSPAVASITSILSGRSSTTSADKAYYRNVARIGAVVAEALAYAHGQKVLHRDIKPSNIMLDVDGAAWVTDFGLAKEEQDNDLTRSGDLVGTLRYMAPERLNGISDAGGDIYGLGLTLYEMLTLRPPFDGSNRGRLLRSIAQDEPPRPGSADPYVPRDLETIVLKAIAKEPRTRYQSAAAMADDLRRFLADRPIQARRTSTVEHIWRWCRRNRMSASLAGVALLALIALSVISTIAAFELRSQRNQLQDQYQRVQAAEHDTRFEIGKSMLAQGASNLRTGLSGRRLESLRLFRQANNILQADPRGQDHLSELRDQVIAANSLIDLSVQWERKIPPALELNVDARLERYVVCERGASQVVVRSMRDDSELMRLPGSATPYWWSWPEFSPDGSYLAVVYFPRDDKVLPHVDVWRLNTGQKIMSLAVPCPAFRFHPDGRQLVTYSGPGTLTVWNIVDQTATRRLTVPAEPFKMAFDCAGKQLALLFRPADYKDRPQQKQLQVLSFETGAEVGNWTTDIGTSDLSWNHDSGLLASGGATGEVFVHHLSGTKPVSILRGHTSGISTCRFAHFGSLLATSSWDGTTRLWDAATGECLTVARGRLNGFSPDDRHLAYDCNARLGVWDLVGGEERLSLSSAFFASREQRVTADDRVEAAEFSPDGRRLAVCCLGGVQIFDAITGDVLARIDAPKCESVLFEAGDRSILTFDEIGLRRWPIHPGSSPSDPSTEHEDRAQSPVATRGQDVTARAWHVGPAQLLYESAFPDNHRAAWLPGQSVLAIFDGKHSSIRLLDVSRQNAEALPLDELSAKYKRVVMLTVSPDGQWIATGGWKDKGIQVWNLRTRRFERLLEPGEGGGDASFWVRFAPDGRLIAMTNTDEKVGYYAFQPGTWQREAIPMLPERIEAAPPVFSRDGAVMALLMSRTQIRLADLATGRPLAHLTAMNGEVPFPLTFSPDGKRLAVATNHGAVQIWNIDRIRQRLVDWNLDWPAK